MKRSFIPIFEPDIAEEEISAVTEAIRNKQVSSSSPPVGKFETAFAEKLGMKHAVAVNSGGSALFLALAAISIKKGDEVIIPDFTMIATATAVSHCGGTPVFVDTAENDLNMDVSKIEEKITPRTKAIIPVHVFGYPADMDAIFRIASAHNLYVIEDAAEAHGAKYKGKAVGTFGIANVFSFHAAKIITTGEGGIITTNDDKIAEKLRNMRGYSYIENTHYLHQDITWNLRMSGLQAALGTAQLARMDSMLEKRRVNALHYLKELASVPGLTFFREQPETFSVYWDFGFLAPFRDELMEFLGENGIETRNFFFPMHEQPPYKADGGFKNSERLARDGISIPISSCIEKEELDYIIGKIKEFYAARA